MKRTDKTKHKSKKLSVIIPSLFIVVGLVVAAFPLLGPIISQSNSNSVIDTYNNVVSSMSDTEIKEAKEKAVKYNTTGESNYYNAVDINKVISYIEIPSIEVYLPVYNDTSTDTLNQGIGHLEGSSLPVGGKGTHCVLTGHSGLTTQTMFSNLEKMTVGDKFYLHTLDETLCYEVYNIVTVLPEEALSYIESDINNDYCTLITCTPVGVNTHRLLVQGKRVEYEELDDENSNEVSEVSYESNEDLNVAKKVNINSEYDNSILVLGIISVTLFVVSFLLVILNRRLPKTAVKSLALAKESIKKKTKK